MEEIISLHGLVTIIYLRFFLSLSNVYRIFVPGFGHIAKALKNRLHKGRILGRTELKIEALEELNQLEQKLICPLVSALPRRNGCISLEADTYHQQTKKIPIQYEMNGQRNHLWSWIRSLTGDEKNFGITRKKYLAVVWPVLLPRTYLESVWFTIQTDHDALQCILNVADKEDKAVQWWLRKSKMEFNVIQWAGSKHQTAEAPYCLKSYGTDIIYFVRWQGARIEYIRHWHSESKPEWWR